MAKSKKKDNTLLTMGDFGGGLYLQNIDNDSLTSYETGKQLLLAGDYDAFWNCVFPRDAYHVFREFLKQHPEIDTNKVYVQRLPYPSEIKAHRFAWLMDAYGE